MTREQGYAKAAAIAVVFCITVAIVTSDIVTGLYVGSLVLLARVTLGPWKR